MDHVTRVRRCMSGIRPSKYESETPVVTFNLPLKRRETRPGMHTYRTRNINLNTNV